MKAAEAFADTPGKLPMVKATPKKVQSQSSESKPLLALPGAACTRAFSRSIGNCSRDRQRWQWIFWTTERRGWGGSRFYWRRGNRSRPRNLCWSLRHRAWCRAKEHIWEWSAASGWWRQPQGIWCWCHQGEPESWSIPSRWCHQSDQSQGHSRRHGGRGYG